MAWPGALAAQDNTIVGNPQLRDFQLPGQRTTPPAQPQPVTPAPAATRPSAATTPAPRPTRTPTETAPTAARPTPSRTTAPAASAPAERAASRHPAQPPARAPATEHPAPAPHRAPPAPVTTAPAPAPVAQAPTPPPQAAPIPAPAPAPPLESPASTGFNLNWLWLALPVLLGLAAFALFRRRQSLGARQEAHRSALANSLFAGEQPRPETPAPELLLADVAPAEPAPVQQPAPAAEAPRPWLELDIEPERAASTQSEASLHYDLVITNVGGEAARNIRIDMRMFNAADEPQIAAFLGGPIHRHSGSPHVTIPPGESLRITAEIAMKAEDVRAIELQGRQIFVPSVAINLAYDWGEKGEGRSSKSWLVGRKAEKPNARMGAFRLDLGPRIYRSVGRKDTKRVMV